MCLWIVSNFVLQVTTGYQELIALSKTISAVLILSIYDHFNLELLLTHLRSLPSDWLLSELSVFLSLAAVCPVWHDFRSPLKRQQVNLCRLWLQQHSINTINLYEEKHIYLCYIFHMRQPWTCCVDLDGDILWHN